MALGSMSLGPCTSADRRPALIAGSLLAHPCACAIESAWNTKMPRSVVSSMNDPLTDDLAAKHYAVRDGLLRCVAVAGCSDLARRRILKQPFEIGNQPEGPL